MPSFRRKASVIDADSTSVTGPSAEPASPLVSEGRVDPALAQIMADEAEAEAAEAEAVAAAARARARALRLRRQAQEVDAPSDGPTAEANTDVADDSPVEEAATSTADEAAESGAVPQSSDADDDVPAEPVEFSDGGEATTADEAAEKPARRRLHLRVPLPTWKGVALFLAVLCTCALLAASGFMIREHRRAERDAQLSAEYTAAGRQAVVTLMSLDFNTAKEDVQRIIDNSTGDFRNDFQQQAETFAQVAQDSKVITEVTVNSAAVKSMTDNSANVLVSATSRITNKAGAEQDPRGWRLSVDLERDGDQVKMSKVEFVP